MSDIDYQGLVDLAYEDTKLLHTLSNKFRDVFVQEVNPKIIQSMKESLDRLSITRQELSRIIGVDPTLLMKIFSGEFGIRINLVSAYCYRVLYTSVHQFLSDCVPSFVMPKNLSYLCSQLSQASAQQKMEAQHAVMLCKQDLFRNKIVWSSIEVTADRLASLCDDRWSTSQRMFSDTSGIAKATAQSYANKGRGLTESELFDVLDKLHEKPAIALSCQQNSILSSFVHQRRYNLSLWFLTFVSLRCGVPIDYFLTDNYLTYATAKYSPSNGGVYHSMFPVEGDTYTVEDTITHSILEHITSIPSQDQPPMIAAAIKELH